MPIHVKPSYFVKATRIYKHWCNVNVCVACGLRAKDEDVATCHPCPNCGDKMRGDVGRWVPAKRPWWMFWSDNGHWELRSSAP